MAGKKDRKHLSPEERALWSKVVEGATPLFPKKAMPVSEVKPAKTLHTNKPEPAPLPDFRIGEKSRGKQRDTALTPFSPPAPRMDARALTKMKRGKLKPQARIDLHGMTVSAAHTALTAFILRASADGLRLVLVITGKGRGDSGAIPETRGVLRRQVPHWLETPPISQAVLQVETAHHRHGGSGAYYVYLRRRQ